ncbi:Aldo/keto reductase-like protein [Hypoxylon sp. NC1633]|nr:Aldo/keto reductase-like protein [Hypoxylon sp. NC1633]
MPLHDNSQPASLGKPGHKSPALTSPNEELLKVLDRAWELCATFWDTAAGYGDSEVLIGKWFKLHPERRRDIFLATKFGLGWKMDDGKVEIFIDSTPENCQAACEQALRKLGTDYVDLFYVHRFDGVIPVEKTMEALVTLKNEQSTNKAGKIKNIGFSGCSSDTLRCGYAVHPISAVQIEYNPWTLDIESDSGTHLLRTCRELDVAVVTYAPLGRGFLTGRYKSLDDFDAKDGRRQLPRFSTEKFSKNLDLVKIFENLAAQKGWGDFIPIPGTKNIHYLEQNLGATNVQISPDENKHIRDAVFAMGGVSGERTVETAAAFADTPAL